MNFIEDAVLIFNLDFKNGDPEISKLNIDKDDREKFVFEIADSVNRFIDDKLTKIQNSTVYKCSKDEIMYIEDPQVDYFKELKEGFLNSVSIETFNGNLDEVDILAIGDKNFECVAFQKIDKSQTLKKNTIFFNKGRVTFNSKPILVLKNNVNCVLYKGTLLFETPFQARKVIKHYDFGIATEEQTKKFLKENFIFEDESAFEAERLSQSLINHIDIVRREGILQIKDLKNKVDKEYRRFIDDEGRVTFPKDKEICKQFFDYLSDSLHPSNFHEDEMVLGNSTRKIKRKTHSSENKDMKN